MPEEDYGDYELEDESILSLVVPASEALPYPQVAQQDDPDEPKLLGFTSITGSTPEEAIEEARTGVSRRTWWGIGQCLRTVRNYYDVPSKYGTAAQSYYAADHKHFVSDGRNVPRGAPVWWTGGSSGAGHVAISVGGGICISTDWKSAGRADYAYINEITSQWGLTFRGFTNEVNDVFVWKPVPPKVTVRLSNLKPGKRNGDVKQVKAVLHKKGYRGFIVSSGKFGPGLRKAYAHYQRRLGYTGAAADGIPGRNSLQKLGFRVV